MGGKWLGVPKEAAPNLTRTAVLFGSDSGPTIAFLHAAEVVAPSLGVAVTAIDVLDGTGMERSVAAFAANPDSGLVVLPHRYTVPNRGSFLVLAARHRLPPTSPFPPA